MVESRILNGRTGLTLPLPGKTDLLHRDTVERPRVLKWINPARGHPLCTLHRAEGLYSWVSRRGLWEIPYTKVNQVCSSYTGRAVQGIEGCSIYCTYSILTLWFYFTYSAIKAWFSSSVCVCGGRKGNWLFGWLVGNGCRPILSNPSPGGPAGLQGEGEKICRTHRTTSPTAPPRLEYRCFLREHECSLG